MLSEARIVAIIEKATKKLLDPTRIAQIVVNNNRLIALDGAGRLWRRFVEARGWERIATPAEAAQQEEAAERRRVYNAGRREAAAKAKRNRRRR